MAPATPFTPPSLWILAVRQGLRDGRAGELRLLVLAVMLAVAALTAVGFFADRLGLGLARDARQLIGGDVVLASDQPAPPVLAERARASGLSVATIVSFPTMGRAPDAHGGASRLVALKAVSDGYPLRGHLRLRDAPEAPERRADGAPVPGTVWVDAGLLAALGLGVGDSLLLGDAALRIAAVIAVEPDRGAGFMSFAPRVLLHAADLPATGLVQPASRIAYRLAVAGQGAEGEARAQAWRAWVEGEIATKRWRGMRIESFEGGRPELRQTLDRAVRFLNLVALLAALLAAVAVGIAARDYASRRLDDCAMLRVLGLSQGRIAGAYAIEFLGVGVLASGLGVALGWGVHHGFVLLLDGLIETALPPTGWRPALLGLGVGLSLLLGFGLPPVLQLARVPPLRVIRRDLGELKPASLGVLAAGVAGFAALLVTVAADVPLGLIAVGGFGVAVALFALLSWGAVALLHRLLPSASAPRWLLLATRQLAARPGYAVLQTSALSVGLLALVLLVLLRTDLIASWRAATPPDAPNRFVINVQPDQEVPFRQALQEAGVSGFDWYPMIRGRLVAVNGRAVRSEDYPDGRAQRLVDREFNLSHRAALPTHNRVSAGRWRDDEAGAVSVEAGLAETLGLRLGDTLRFDIAGTAVEARITSVRTVDWGSMRVNFFVLFPQAEMPDMPVTYLAAFRAPERSDFDNALVHAFPNITNVDVSASIAQVQRVLDQVIRAVEFLFVFALASGLVVLFATLSATREPRAREYAVMRALGAGARLLRRVQRVELLGVGALAGVLAAAAALAIGWALAHWVFGFSWRAPLWVLLASGIAGALLALAAGWWGLREVLARPVVETLRRASE